MDEKNIGQIMEEIHDQNTETDPEKDDLKERIEKGFEQIRTQSMALGMRTACMTIYQMIQPWHNTKSTHNDYKRIFKKVEQFCLKAVNNGIKTPVIGDNQTGN